MVKAAYAMIDNPPLIVLHPILTFKDVIVTENGESYRRDPESVAGVPCDDDTVFDFVAVPSALTTVLGEHDDMYGDWADFAVGYPETYNHGDIETYLAWYDPAGFKEDEPLPDKGQEEMVDKMFAPVNSIEEVPMDYRADEYDDVDQDAGEEPPTDEEIMEDFNDEVHNLGLITDFGSTYTWIAGGRLIIYWLEDENSLRIKIDLTKGTARLESVYL